MTVPLAVQKLFSLMKSHLLTVHLSAGAVGVLFRTSFPVPRSSKLPQFLFYKVKCIWFYVKFLIHLELSFEQGGKYESICILLCADISLTSPVC